MITTKTLDRCANALAWAVMLLTAYVAISFAAFRVRHPWPTETQVMLHTTDALAWRSLEKP